MKTLESHVLRKRACVVRWGAGGKGLLKQYLACGLPDFYRGDVILLVSVVKFRNRVEHVIDNYRR